MSHNVLYNHCCAYTQLHTSCVQVGNSWYLPFIGLIRKVVQNHTTVLYDNIKDYTIIAVLVLYYYYYIRVTRQKSCTLIHITIVTTAETSDYPTAGDNNARVA